MERGIDEWREGSGSWFRKRKEGGLLDIKQLLAADRHYGTGVRAVRVRPHSGS